MVRQGEVHDHLIGTSRFRVLVVSSDSHNVTRVPWVAPIRHGGADMPPFLIALADPDPLGGAIDLDRLRRVDLLGEPVGLVTGATMSRVREAITTVFAG